LCINPHTHTHTHTHTPRGLCAVDVAVSDPHTHTKLIWVTFNLLILNYTTVMFVKTVCTELSQIKPCGNEGVN